MSADLIRLAQGHISAYDLLSNDDYVVLNWIRTADMSSELHWMATQPEIGVQAEFVPSLAVGSGNFYGGYSGVVEFFILSPLMRDYLEETFLDDKGVAAVTAYLHDPRSGSNSGYRVFQGELISPFSLNAETTYTRFSDNTYANVQYLFRRGLPVSLEVLATISDAVITTLSGEYLATLDQE